MLEIVAKQMAKADTTALPFCHCSKKMVDRRLATNKALKVTCQCGEDIGRVEWTWDKTSGTEAERTDVIFEENTVDFHPVYSQGTAVVKGEQPLAAGKHHYWEVKIMSFLTGTDLMIGIGTDKVNIRSHNFSYSSFLGLDDQSWGFSYRGLAQNAGRIKYYGKTFSRGSIVGVYLDLERGTLEYYLNRRPLGKAYTNIPINKDVKIYPMVCSTSAKTSVKLINSTSVNSSLQFQCMKIISRRPQLLEQIKPIPGLSPLLNELWFLQTKEQYEYAEFEENNLLLEDEALIGSKKKKYIEETDSTYQTNAKKKPQTSTAANAVPVS